MSGRPFALPRRLWFDRTLRPSSLGPFPKKLFNAVLLSSQTILDRFHSIRCVVNREDWNASLYKSHIAPVNAERREMVGNVMLAFTTISAGFKLKAPMPPYLPPAERARQRLLRKAEKLALVQVPGSGSRHLLFFSCECSLPLSTSTPETDVVIDCRL